MQEVAGKRLLNSESIATAQTEQEQHWAALQSIEDPLLLDEAMHSQGLKCIQDGESSNLVAGHILGLLKQRDAAYVQLLQQQAQEIDQLLQLLQDQTFDFESSCTQQLAETEAMLSEARPLLLPTPSKK